MPLCRSILSQPKRVVNLAALRACPTTSASSFTDRMALMQTQENKTVCLSPKCCQVPLQILCHRNLAVCLMYLRPLGTGFLIDRKVCNECMQLISVAISAPQLALEELLNFALGDFEATCRSCCPQVVSRRLS